MPLLSGNEFIRRFFGFDYHSGAVFSLYDHWQVRRESRA
jgi:hypothetical protein